MDHLQNVMGYFDQQQPLCAEHDRISKDLYKEFGVKAGLRDENGKGVLAGLTNISDIRAFQYVDGVKKPADGQPVSYTHLTLPTTLSQCRSRWSPYH